jgi:hypothetical protein
MYFVVPAFKTLTTEHTEYTENTERKDGIQEENTGCVSFKENRESECG